MRKLIVFLFAFLKILPVLSGQVSSLGLVFQGGMQMPGFFDIALGMMLMMLLLMLITWRQMGDKSYMWYGIFASGQLIYLFFEHYVDFKTLNPNWEQSWISALDFNFPDLIYLSYLGFLERFFSPHFKSVHKSSGWLLAGRILLYLHLGADLSAWLSGNSFDFRQYISLIRNIGIVFLAAMLIRTLRRSKVPAFQLFILGSLSLLVGGALATLADLLNYPGLPALKLSGWMYYFVGNPGFYLTLGAIAEMLFFYLGFTYRIKIMQAEKLFALEQERGRISRDLHDDLGSGLGAIGLLSNIALSKTGRADMSADVSKIAESARDLSDKIHEIIWAANVHNDTLEKLIDYLHLYAATLFEGTNIGIQARLPARIPSAVISGERRRALFLAFKEALHNIVKHAGASQVEIGFDLSSDQITVTLRDNGRGFDPDYVCEQSNGLTNMRRRIEDAGGVFRIDTGKQGTAVVFWMPV